MRARPDPDDLYELLIGCHAGLSPDESRLFLVKLAMLLADQIGDRAKVIRVITEARNGLGTSAGDDEPQGKI